MTRATPIINSFAGGEISPHLDARSDIQWYHSSCRRLENLIPRAQGGILRRGGTRFIRSVESAASRHLLIPFEFSTLQAYMLVAGDSNLQFFKDKAVIVAADIDTAISNGAFGTDLTGWADDDAGSGASAHTSTGGGRMRLTSGGTTSSDIAARTQTVTVAAGDQAKEHILVFRVIGAAGDKALLNVGTSAGGGQLINDRECYAGWHAVAFTPAAATIYVRFKNKGDNNNQYTNQNKALDIDDVSFLTDAPLEIPTPWPAADLVDSDGRSLLRWTQSNDVLYLVHGDYKPYKLSRSGHTTWALTEIAFDDGPYYDENTTAITLTPGAATGAGVTMTASSITAINGGAGFASTDIGRLIRAKEGSTWGWGIIVGWTSTTVVTVDIRSTLTNTNAKSAWQIGLWSDTDGWPVAAMFFEERLLFGGAGGRPNRWDGSASGDFENFTPGTADGDALAFTIASDQVNAIRWMAPASKLLLGTLGAEFAAGGSGSVDATMTPTNVNVRLQTRHGVADVPPALVGSNAVLFVQRQGRKLREIAFSFEADGYVSEDMTIRAEHVTRGGLVAMAWQQEPFGILWAVRQDGRLLGFTYLRSQQVTAWHQHPVAGGAADVDLSGTAMGAVESLAVIPGPTTTSWGEDQLWLIVRRTIDGATVRYIEILEPPLADDQDNIEAFYVDSGLTYDGAVAATLTPGAGATVQGTTGVTFTAGSAVFAGTSADVGREIRYHRAADPEANPPQTAIEARAVVTAAVDTTHVTCTILGAFPSLDAIASGAWRLSVTTISGLDHLEGESVQILTDGAVHPAETVSGGAVSLDYPATYVQAGLGFTSTLKPVKFEAGAQEGTAQGKKKRVSKVTLRLHRTLGCKVGRDAANLDELPFRDYGGLMDQPPDLFTGDKEITFRGNYDTSGDVLVVQDQPLPLAVLAAMPVLATAEGG